MRGSQPRCVRPDTPRALFVVLDVEIALPFRAFLPHQGEAAFDGRLGGAEADRRMVASRAGGLDEGGVLDTSLMSSISHSTRFAIM